MIVVTAEVAGSQTWDTIVVGGALAGLAAAARLAKNRHRVLVLEAHDRLGGRWAPHPMEGADDAGTAELVDSWPGMISFPAPWRDLFRKSGRPFVDELARTDQALVPAPAARHVFTESVGGSDELVLPSERGVQFTVLSQRYGATVAERWRDLLDHLDEVAQALRPLGGEAELTSYDQITGARSVLSPGRSVADLARAIDHPHLSALVTSTAWRLGSRADRTPGWVAAQLANERRFGRWMITTADRPDRTSVLLDRLVDRLRTRRVTVRTDHTVTAITRTSDGTLEVAAETDTGPVLERGRTAIVALEPGQAYRLLGRAAGAERRRAARTRPALAPVVTHTLTEPTGTEPTGTEPTETIIHGTGTAGHGGPVVRWTRPVPNGGVLTSEHDWGRATPDPGAGIAWHGPRTVMRQPPIRSAMTGVHLAGPFSRGGSDLAHIVLSGALASYACHEMLVDG